MARILRGEIHWTNLYLTQGREQAGHRSVLILSQSVFNECPGTVTAVALTSQAPKAGFPLTLELSSVGLPKQSWVRISQIRTPSVTRLGDRIGQATPEEIELVVEGLNDIIGN